MQTFQFDVFLSSSVRVQCKLFIWVLRSIFYIWCYQVWNQTVFALCAMKCFAFSAGWNMKFNINAIKLNIHNISKAFSDSIILFYKIWRKKYLQWIKKYFGQSIRKEKLKAVACICCCIVWADSRWFYMSKKRSNWRSKSRKSCPQFHYFFDHCFCDWNCQQQLNCYILQPLR